jgi:hypothetical protein
MAELAQIVGNGLKAHHCFGRLRDRPKPAGFGEVARACWMAGGSAVGQGEGVGHEGQSDETRCLGAERKRLRTRGLAVGSSPLPWAHSTLAAPLVPVKGLVGPGRGGVCSRGARGRSGRPTPGPVTVAPSAARRHGGGGDGEPLGSTDRPPTARRNAGISAADTGVAAPSGGVRPEFRRPTPRVRSPCQRPARASARRTNPDFSAATVPGAKTASLPRSGARASGSAARPAVRRCAASSSASGGGGSGHAGAGPHLQPAGAAGLELVVA